LLQRPENSFFLVAMPGVVAVMVVTRIVGVVAMMVTVVMMVAVVAMMVVAMMVVAMMMAVPSCGWNGTGGRDCANNT